MLGLAAVGYGGSRLVVPPAVEEVRSRATTSTDRLQLGLPAGWKWLPRGRLEPALGFTESLRAAPGGRGPALVTGMINSEESSLLPSGRLQAGPLQLVDVVTLGALPALRYRGVGVRGAEGRFTLYAVPTSAAVATIACPAVPFAFAVRCERTAETLELLGVRPEDIGPSDAYARSLGAVLSVVDRARRIGGRALMNARRATSQARAADDLATDHETAMQILRQLDPAPGDRGMNRDLVRALRRHVTGYQLLAAAARGGMPRRYRAARRVIGEGVAALDRALRRLRAAGYSVVRAGARRIDG